ncbi:selenocysteine-specific elongation factor isoform X2 [Teleopsis dalmanni]|nr:selenocysteine-specific elongation factor isoform X2 [Teleopsis dalmanni]
MLLVIDAQKGIQTQTAECIVIAGLLKKKVIVVVNKIDLLEEATRNELLIKLNKKLQKALNNTSLGINVPIFNVSAQNMINIEELICGIKSHIHVPKRDITSPLVLYVDHCFSIKGQGTICTGTIMQGTIKVEDVVEIPSISEQRKVKSIQMFRQSVSVAEMGDRVGVCVTQFNSKLLERGIITKPGYLHSLYAICIRLNRIEYFKYDIKSKSKLHCTVGHDTVMANITLFHNVDENSDEQKFNINNEYEYIEQLEASDTTQNCNQTVFVLLEFEKPIIARTNATIIASKLDMDIQSNSCRLAFWGEIEWHTLSKNYISEELPKFKIFKRKVKQGSIQRVSGDNQVIVQNLFKKEGNRDYYVGKNVELSTGEIGIIESTFGQTSKVKIHFPKGLKNETIQLLLTKRANEILVYMKLKKYIFNKNL